MTPTFQVVPYKAMQGFYVRATWPSRCWQNIDVPKSTEPAFLTEAEAELWIDTQSSTWVPGKIYVESIGGGRHPRQINIAMTAHLLGQL